MSLFTHIFSVVRYTPIEVDDSIIIAVVSGVVVLLGGVPALIASIIAIYNMRSKRDVDDKTALKLSAESAAAIAQTYSTLRGDLEREIGSLREHEHLMTKQVNQMAQVQNELRAKIAFLEQKNLEQEEKIRVQEEKIEVLQSEKADLENLLLRFKVWTERLVAIIETNRIEAPAFEDFVRIKKE